MKVGEVDPLVFSSITVIVFLALGAGGVLGQHRDLTQHHPDLPLSPLPPQ